MAKNPIDPATGKPRRGRPRKVTPVDTIAGPQAEEKAVREPGARVVAQDPKGQISTALAQDWERRMAGTAMMDIPPEAKEKYPDGNFCWVKDSKEAIIDYRTRFGYEPVNVDAPLPGQTDTCVRFGDTLLMVRSQELKKIHDKVRRDKVLAQMGKSASPGEAQAEREALIEARQQGYGRGGKNVSFFEDEATEGPLTLEREIEEHKQAIMNQPGRTRMAGGTKYVSGGLSK